MRFESLSSFFLLVGQLGNQSHLSGSMVDSVVDEMVLFIFLDRLAKVLVKVGQLKLG